MKPSQSRREFLLRSAAVGGMLLPAWMLACGKKTLVCTDTIGLKPDEIATRTALQYTDAATEANKTCSTCQLYKPAGPDQCGACTVVKGPVHPQGSCKSWAAKQPA
jgi:hypothetical protein